MQDPSDHIKIMTSHLQALAVVVQNWPNREIPVLSQTQYNLSRLMSFSNTSSSESVEPRVVEDRVSLDEEMSDEEPDEEMSDEETDEEYEGIPIFDEYGVVIAHHRICEWCTPFHPFCCNGIRMCRKKADYYNAQSCERTTYLCKDMPKVGPMVLSLQDRIVTFAGIWHGMHECVQIGA